MQWLNYHHLFYFYVIANAQSIAAATSELRLAQSTLSAQLRQFEDMIGFRLFERRNKKMVLTELGQRVYDYAHEIFSLGQELRDTLSLLSSEKELLLRAGVVDSIPKTLSRHLLSVIGEGPGLRTTIEENALDSLKKKLSQNQIDIVLANDPISSEETKFRPHVALVGELPIVFVAHPSRAALKKNFPRSLDLEPFIMPGTGNSLRNEILNHFRIKRVQPRIIADIDDAELLKMLLLDNLGVGAVASICVQKEIDDGLLMCLSETPLCHERIWLMSSHRGTHHPMVQTLLKDFRIKDIKPPSPKGTR